MAYLLKWRGLALVALLLSTTTLHAQEALPLRATLDDTVVTENAPPAVSAFPPDDPVVTPKRKPPVTNPYAPTGISDGAFTIFPSLEIDTEIHRNVRQSSTASQFDVALRLKPSVSFASNWSRHSLSGNVSAEWLRHGMADDLNSVTGSANVDLRLDIHHDLQADLKASYAVTQTGLGTSQLPASAATPRTDQSANFSASLARDLGGLVVTSTAALTRNTYGDVRLVGGGTQTNSDLNYYEPSLSLRGSLGGKGSRLLPFAEVRYAPRFHDTAVDRNGVARNSQGGGIAVGVTLDDGPFWTGEMAATADYRHYAAASLGDAFALGFVGNLTWLPTPLDKATLTTSLSQDETSTAGQAVSTNWAADLEVSHALRDNFRLLAGAGLGLTSELNGMDKSANIHAGFQYDMNPYLATRLTAQQTSSVNAAGTSGYSDQSLIASIILRR